MLKQNKSHELCLESYPILDSIVKFVELNKPYRLFNYRLLKGSLRTNPNPNEIVLSKFDYNDPYFIPTVVSMLKTEVFLNKKFNLVENITSYKDFVENESSKYLGNMIDMYFSTLNYFVTLDKELDLEKHFVQVTRNPNIFPELNQVVFIYEIIRVLANSFITPRLVYIQPSPIGAITLFFRIDPSDVLGYETVFFLTKYGSLPEAEYLKKVMRSYKYGQRKKKKSEEETIEQGV